MDKDGGLVDELNKKLYAKGDFKVDLSRTSFSLPHNETAQNFVPHEDSMSKSLLSTQFLKKFFVFALCFFLLASVAAYYIVSTGSNIVSSDNLELAIKGPVSIGGGEELALSILIANNNPTDLETVDLAITFPEGTREAGNLEKSLVRYRKNLGDIKKGEIRNESIKAILFAEAGSEQSIAISLEYRTAGSNAIFDKKKVYKVLVTSSPIVVSIDAPSEVNTDSQVDIVIGAVAGTDNPLPNILLNVNYPSGFRFISATPKPFFGNNVWNLGTLVSGQKRQIRITGILGGQDEEKKLFRVTTGVANQEREDVIAVPYTKSDLSLTMRRAFVDLGLTLIGSDSSDVVVKAANTIRGDINWTNNLPDKLLNAELSVKLAGNALDQSSVTALTGAYRSLDNTISWTRISEPTLAVLESGSKSHLSFDLATLSTGALNSLGIKNPYIDIEITFKANRVVDGAPGALVTSVVRKKVRVDTRLGLTARAVYSGGPLVNTGPMPPLVNTETSYTLTWSISNTSNDLGSVRVSAILPTYMRFMGTFLPSDSDVRYDSSKGELSWLVGNVPARASDAPVREVSFQLALLPSITHLGQSLPLLNNVQVVGRDLFTGSDLSASVNTVDMRIVTDPNFQEGWSKVSQ